MPEKLPNNWSEIRDRALSADDRSAERRLAEGFVGGDESIDQATIERYVSGQGSPSERELVEAAMEVDPHVRSMVDALQEVQAELALGAGLATSPPAPARRPWFAWTGWLVAGACGAALVGVWMQRAPTGEMVASETPVAESAAPTNLTTPPKGGTPDLISEVERLQKELLARTNERDEARQEAREAANKPPLVITRTGPTKPSPGRPKPDRPILRDGKGKIVETPSGLARIESIEGIAGRLAIDPSLEKLVTKDPSRGPLRWPAGGTDPSVPDGPVVFELIDPFLVAVRSKGVEFGWKPVEGAAEYRVTVFLNQSVVAESDWQAKTDWQAGEALAPGETFRWRVTARSRDGRELSQANVGDLAAQFRTLSEREEAALDEALGQAGDSKFLRIRALAKFGLLIEARKLAQELVKENPNSEVARRLQRQLERRENS